MPDLAITPLDDLATLAVRGNDAVQFLQGQLSHDMSLLPERGSLLAGYHNPQGRCLALLRLFYLGPDQVLAVLPAELLEPIQQQLGRYVLRSKVKLEDASANWRLYGICGPDAQAAASTRLHSAMDGSGLRQLIVAPRNEPLPEGDVEQRATWRLADIQDGMPEVAAANSGSFVAQMLNLDCLDAISLTKGCYTGQEVVARAHYRGQVKRRMQRFYTESSASLQPGAKVLLGDGRLAQIVMAAPTDIGQEFLAVTTLPGDSGDAAAAGAMATSQLPLPYALPTP